MSKSERAAFDRMVDRCRDCPGRCTTSASTFYLCDRHSELLRAIIASRSTVTTEEVRKELGDG